MSDTNGKSTGAGRWVAAVEECGLEVRLDPRPVTSYVAKRNETDMLVVAFRAESEAGDVVLSHEHEEYAWMTLEEFAEACPFPLLVAAAREAMRSTGRLPTPAIDPHFHPARPSRARDSFFSSRE